MCSNYEEKRGPFERFARSSNAFLTTAQFAVPPLARRSASRSSLDETMRLAMPESPGEVRALKRAYVRVVLRLLCLAIRCARSSGKSDFRASPVIRYFDFAMRIFT